MLSLCIYSDSCIDHYVKMSKSVFQSGWSADWALWVFLVFGNNGVNVYKQKQQLLAELLLIGKRE